MGGSITKTALGSMTIRANNNLEIHGDIIGSIAKERVIEKGEDGGLDVKIGVYSPSEPDTREE